MGSVKTALQKFLLERNDTEESASNCKFCMAESTEKVGMLSGDFIKIVQCSLLVSLDAKRSMWVFGDFEALLEKLSGLFFQLQGLRSEFNDLRKEICRKVIVQSLGRSEEEWETFFEKDIRATEDYYPSVCFLNPEGN